MSFAEYVEKKIKTNCVIAPPGMQSLPQVSNRKHSLQHLIHINKSMNDQTLSSILMRNRKFDIVSLPIKPRYPIIPMKRSVNLRKRKNYNHKKTGEIELAPGMKAVRRSRTKAGKSMKLNSNVNSL